MLHVFIVNINAGKKNNILIGKIIDEYCESININYSINYVYEKKDTNKIIEKLKKYKDVIIYSVGGDGTLNQIINCIANTNMSLNVIPNGTGNDFYKSLINFNGNKIDLGKVNEKYFINVASFGIDAAIANTANEFKNNNFKGKLVYPISIIKNYFSYEYININDKNNLITLLAICNGGFYGGGFNISPNCKLNDGLFNVYEVEKINRIEILKLFLKLLKGNHINDNKVKVYKTDKITIESKINLICNLDGEILKGNNFEFAIYKEAINISNDEIKIKQFLKDRKII